MTTSLDAVKRKARLLQRGFPAHFTLAQAQEATSRLLGFKDWHDLVQAHKAGRQVLPEERTGPERPNYAATLAELIVKLTDGYGLPPTDVHPFLLGWGVFLPQLDAPFTPEYFSWEEALREADLRGGSSRVEDTDDELGDPDPPEVGVVIEGVLVVLSPYGKHDYWFPSPQRLKAMPPHLRGDLSAFLSHENSALVVLSFPDEFSAAAHKRAVKFMEGFESRLLDWHQGSGKTARYEPELELQLEPPYVSEIRLKALAQPDDWFALSYRWQALPAGVRESGPPQVVIPALRGRNLVELIDSFGHYRLADVQWFIPNKGNEQNAFGNPLFHRDCAVLDLRHLTACQPHYASPFKRAPFSSLEYEVLDEAGDPGLAYVPPAHVPQDADPPAAH